MTREHDAFLFVYFANGDGPDVEQIRFAVSDGPDPTRWWVLADGSPVLRSGVGEGGARDPFVLRDLRTGRFHLLATDLRAVPNGDWARAVRHGSRNLVVWHSDDLVHWSDPQLTPIAPPNAGNAWAPKAVWDDAARCWKVFFAAALYAEDDDRAHAAHQRILVAQTDDFTTFGPAEVAFDRGHDVIDAAYLQAGDAWYRFSADSLSDDPTIRSQHVSQEVGSDPTAGDFTLVANEIDGHALRRGEGPAPFSGLDGDGHYLLVDEFELRGYQLFHAQEPSTGSWRHLADARLPPGARHGSVLPITAAERDRLITTFGATRA
ncbi:glycoside hydrolase family 43 protein [Curtobacterium luteum]|uniref:glycoside hydrolase family 43 protein n=1 Tax=Curtobacterium luteum TaxID=33881 RepID=UPI003802644C